MKISELQEILEDARHSIGDAEIVLGNSGTKTVKTFTDRNNAEKLLNCSAPEGAKVCGKHVLITPENLL